MAVRPSAQLALELVSLKFMPVQEGIAHLVRELEAGAPEPEVVITDQRQCRIHDPSEPPLRVGEPRPLLRGASPIEGGWSLQLDPRREPFLREHRLKGFPVLPLAFALEILAEAALSEQPEAKGLVLEEIRAEEILTFRAEGPRNLRALVEDGGRVRLMAAPASSNGGSKRVFCSGRVRPGEAPSEELTIFPSGPWIDVDYDRELAITHGSSLRGLKAWQMVGTELWGRILAPPITYLLDFERIQGGWLVPSGLLDACFYAAGVYLYIDGGQTALPSALQRLEMGRPPQPVYCRDLPARHHNRIGLKGAWLAGLAHRMDHLPRCRIDQGRSHPARKLQRDHECSR